MTIVIGGDFEKKVDFTLNLYQNDVLINTLVGAGFHEGVVNGTYDVEVLPNVGYKIIGITTVDSMMSEYEHTDLVSRKSVKFTNYTNPRPGMYNIWVGTEVVEI